MNKIVLLLVVLVIAACSSYAPFDDTMFIESELDRRLPDDLRGRVEIPFELDAELRGDLEGRVNPAAGERERRDQILDYVFGHVGLQYALTPTRDANETRRAREGNCMSFVNLFVGIGRHVKLNPFYVEVRDYQRWNYQDGVVVSRGHIVAGLYVDGQLATFDFLPYSAKSYRDFEPIDDLTAMAHYYNNLGAEALIENDQLGAADSLEMAVALAPDFDKAINNLGILRLRQGRAEEAVDIYRRGLELHPDNVPLLSNLARSHQELGNRAEAEALFARLEELNETSPFFFVYRGDLALGSGDVRTALEYMRRALQVDDRLPEVHLGLVRVYLALGEVDKARHHVERALRLDATHREARRYASMLEGRAG